MIMNKEIENNFYLLLEKKSKFYSYAFKIFNEKDANRLIELLKEHHIKASHIVYSYRIGSLNSLLEKSFNAKEPQGTASRPLIKVLNLKNTSNIIIVIARYYGGVKLGKSLLSRSYFKAAIGALENAKLSLDSLS